MRRLASPFAAALLSASATAALADDAADASEAAFNNACRTCHSWNEDDNRLGPNLFHIVGRKAGAAKDYAYSGTVQNSAITWDEANLDKFIADPEGFLPGNNMKPFTGISDAATRKSIIDFLKTK